MPELAELWVEYELPRQDVVPAVTRYRYVKAGDQIVPEPRKETERGRLYEKLIARVALRTLAEAFDVAPVTLVNGIMVERLRVGQGSCHRPACPAVAAERARDP